MATHIDSQDHLAGSSRTGRRWLPPAVLATVVALALLAEWLRAPALLKAFLAAPIYYGLPLGVGLLVTRHLESALTRTQQALLAYFCGLVLICVVMVAREHAVPAKLSIHWFSSLIFLAAVAGLATGHKLFAWNRTSMNAAREYLIVVPIFATEYALRFGVFSDFPVTDLFQATHVMKGAREFARFDVLNPFSAGSYVPVIQVMEGLMIRYLGFEPLLGVWTVGAFSTIPKFLACRAAFQCLFRADPARLFATAIGACFLSAATPTNGDLAALGTFLIFSLSTRGAGDGRLTSAARVLIVGLLGLGLGYAATRSLPVIYVAVLAGACLLPFCARLLHADRSVLAIGLLVVSLVPIHRSTLAFVPLALLLGASMPLLTPWVQADNGARLRRIGAGTLALTGLAALGVLALLVWIRSNPGQDLRHTGPGEWLVETIIGTTFADPNVSAGSGPKVALFELARVVVPSLAVFSGMAVAGAVFQAKRCPDVGTMAAGQALLAWGMAVALGSVLLVGVPFVYRSAFLIVILLAIAMVAAWQVFEANDARPPYAAVLAMAAVYAAVVIPAIYQCGAVTKCERSDYVDMARPFLVTFGLLICAGAIGGALWLRAPGAKRYVLPAMLVLLFAFERSFSKAYFMPYSYGEERPTESRAISHLSKEEIDLAAVVRSMGNHVVIVSDPYTMANLRALTGLNSLVTYANLDTLSEASRMRLREWLREVTEPVKDPAGCARRHPLEALDESVNTAEFDYWLARLARPEVPGTEILRQFGFSNTFFATVHPSRKGVADRYSDREWRRAAADELEARFPGDPALLLVINRKTIRWAHGEDVTYFPDVRPLEYDVVHGLTVHCKAKVHDGRFGLILFRMARR